MPSFSFTITLFLLFQRILSYFLASSLSRMPFFIKAWRQWRALGGGNGSLHTRDGGSFFTIGWDKEERNDDITQRKKRTHIWTLVFPSASFLVFYPSSCFPSLVFFSG